MAETETTDDKAESGSLTVKDALKMYEDYKSYWSDNYREALVDLKMVSGDKETQWGAGWDSAFQSLPTNKPTVVVNQLPQFVHQVTNDIRQNTPSIKIIPATDADIEDAEVREDLIRDIQQQSAADEVYDTAAEYAVKCGIGFIRIDHQFCNDKSGNQEIVLKRVNDPLSILIDPASLECDGRDSMGAIALEPINKDQFDKLYPGKAFISFTDHKNKEPKDNIAIAEIFVKEVIGNGAETSIIIHRYKFSGEDQLAYTTFPGDYVPIIPVYGEETWIDGKRILASLIRQARDPQRRLNHWASKESELLAMAPTAPVMAVEGTVVNERGQWQNPGREMLLEYRQQDLDGNPAPPPQRLNPPAIPTGVINAMEGAKQNIRESLGLYNANVGQREGDASGVALNQLQKQGDVATFHFADNLRRSVTQCGRITDSMIPIIYDTPRILQAVNEEEESRSIGVNGAPLQPGQSRPFDLTKGTYHVRVSTGASYATKRQEASAFLSDLFKQAPALMQIGGDILLNNLDLPGARALAARVKKTIPPQLLDDNDNTDPRVPQLMQEVQKMQQIIQQGAQEIQQLQAELKSKAMDQQVQAGKLAIESKKLDVEQQKLQVEAFRARTEAIQPFVQPQQQAASGIPVSSDMSEDQIMAVLSSHKQAQENQAAQEQAEKDRQAQLEAAEFAQKQQEIELRAKQTNAVLETLAAIASQINALTAHVAAPKRVMRDPQTGAITGVQ